MNWGNLGDEKGQVAMKKGRQRTRLWETNIVMLKQVHICVYTDNMYIFIHSFIHPFIHPFIHSFIHLFIHSFISFLCVYIYVCSVIYTVYIYVYIHGLVWKQSTLFHPLIRESPVIKSAIVCVYPILRQTHIMYVYVCEYIYMYI